jgi:hypothetical protein
MEAGDLAPSNLIQPTISLEIPVPSQGHCGFPSLLTDFVCFLIFEFCLSLWKIARCSVILLLPLCVNFTVVQLYLTIIVNNKILI